MIKLYENDSYIKNFAAEVVSCEEIDGAYWAELDKTAFFPEGGGQAADTGSIGDAKVTDVQEKNGRVLHRVTKPVEVGITLECSINWEQRFSRMQNHSGEHILSGIIHGLYGLNNVGFHLGSEVTFDVDGPLSDEQLLEVENRANKAVYANAPVTVSYPSAKELETLDYRSKIDAEAMGQVRIITIEGFDCCACCAPHVARTGEIGIIKILGSMSFRGGTRIFIACGGEALRDYQQKHSNNAQIMRQLSAKVYDTPAAVERTLEALAKSKQAINELTKRLALSRMSGAVKEGSVIYLFAEDAASDEIQHCINSMMEQGDGLCAVFSGSDTAGYSFALGSNSIELSGIIGSFNKALNGRGGGKGNMIRGKLTAGRADIVKYLQNISL